MPFPGVQSTRKTKYSFLARYKGLRIEIQSRTGNQRRQNGMGGKADEDAVKGEVFDFTWRPSGNTVWGARKAKRKKKVR